MRKEEIIVIDIETVSASPSFEDLECGWQELWMEKTKRQFSQETDAASHYSRRAGVMAEFGKIICICIGYQIQQGDRDFTTRLFYGVDEGKLLSEFISFVGKLQRNSIVWAGHNIREFDIPFISRRLLVNGIGIPDWLDLQNRKPWEVEMLDTFQYWRFGDYKNYTSLKLLAQLFRIPSSKKDMDGSMVGAYYWEKDPITRERNIIRIAEYCQKDVEVCLQLIRKMTDLF